MVLSGWRTGVGAIGVVALVSLLGTATVAAATTTTECGLLRDYVAPDPLGPTDGSISFGLSGSPEVIAAGATLVPPVDTNLSGLTGGAPTALTVVRDAGIITSLAFAPSCVLNGDVTFVPDLFGPGADGYIVEDRLVAPVDLMAINDGLAALIPTAAANGSPLSIEFIIDLSMGTPSAFHAQVTLVGEVQPKPNGDMLVGQARLPASVISDGARDRLGQARQLRVPATVEVTGEGAPDQASPGAVAMMITLSVSFEAPMPSPSDGEQIPDTATRTSDHGTAPVLPILALSTLAAALSTLAVRSAHRRRASAR
jgi:hypothetical protein